MPCYRPNWHVSPPAIAISAPRSPTFCRFSPKPVYSGLILWRCWATAEHGIARAKPCSLRHIDRHGRKPLKECLPASSWSRFESPSGHAGSELFFRDEKLQLLARRDEAILSGRPAAEVERRGIGRLELREILLEGLIDMGSCALHDVIGDLLTFKM